jgi:hypothetical protein
MYMTRDSRLPAAYQQAVFRWKGGHQNFHIILTTMNTIVGECMLALQNEDYSLLAQQFRYLCRLYHAATANMVYSADFPPELYEKFIRPSMMPPFLSPGFSGTLNTDHNVMLEGMRQLSKALYGALGTNQADWPAQVAETWEELRRAQIRNRQHHGLVCQKFVAGGVSLLRDFHKQRRSQQLGV